MLSTNSQCRVSKRLLHDLEHFTNLHLFAFHGTTFIICCHLPYESLIFLLLKAFTHLCTYCLHYSCSSQHCTCIWAVHWSASPATFLRERERIWASLKPLVKTSEVTQHGQARVHRGLELLSEDTAGLMDQHTHSLSYKSYRECDEPEGLSKYEWGLSSHVLLAAEAIDVVLTSECERTKGAEPEQTEQGWALPVSLTNTCLNQAWFVKAELDSEYGSGRWVRNEWG